MPVSDQVITSDRYTLIPRTLIFLTRADRVLLMRGAPHKRRWANLYNGLGGHVEAGEGLLGSARRELAEESGLEGVDLWLCGWMLVDTGASPGVGVFIFRGECPHGEPRGSDEGAPEWVPFDALAHLPLVEDLHVLLPQALAQQPGQPPFSARLAYDPDGRPVVSFEA